MKKFFNKLESKLDGSSNNNNQQRVSSSSSNTAGFSSGGRYTQPQQPQQSQQQYQQYPQQQQFGQQQQYGQQQQSFNQPPGPPPPQQQQYGAAGGGGYAQQPAPASRPGVEDPFAALKRYDTVFIVDDSESMEMFWDETREALVGVVERAVQYDEDGIDIYFFNSPVVVENLRTAQDVRSLFRRVEPRRSTPTAKALKRVIEPYLVKLEQANIAKQSGRPDNGVVKPLNIVVLTDGAPDRNEEPEGVIVNAGKRLDAIRAPLNQLGFSFVQIGVDEEAQEALTYLDDHLRQEHNIRDIVDTTLSPPGGQVSAEYLLKALLGGVNRKLDKQNY